MSAPEIRVAEPGDVPALAAFRRTWDTGATGPGETAEEFDARFATWWSGESHRRTFWVAWHEGEPVGLTGLLEYRAMPTPGAAQRCWGYLGNMYVAAPFRGQGLGGRLLATVLAAADTRGYRRVVLAPSPRSVPFYLRAGFVDAGTDAAGDRLLVLRLRPATVS